MDKYKRESTDSITQYLANVSFEHMSEVYCVCVCGCFSFEHFTIGHPGSVTKIGLIPYILAKNLWLTCLLLIEARVTHVKPCCTEKLVMAE